MNKVILNGRLSTEPDMRFTPNKGTAVVTFTIAVQKNRKNSEGKYDADFIPIVVYGKQGEKVCEFTKKGKFIAIAGRLNTRNYEDKEGIKRYITEVIAEEVQFIEWAKSSKENKSADGLVETDEEVPF